MNEQEKINEAHYFLEQLSALGNERDKFRYNLSAFLSAARSPLQYACNEASHKPAVEGGMTTKSPQTVLSNSLGTSEISASTKNPSHQVSGQSADLFKAIVWNSTSKTENTDSFLRGGL